MSEWRRCTIKDIASRITSGGTPSTKNKSFYDGNIPWLNTKEVKNCRIYETENYISDAGLENSSAKWVEENSVIVAMYGATAGKIAINKIKLTTNQACCNITLSNKAEPEFIYYNLLSRYDEIENQATGAAQQNLNVGGISSLEVLLPPKAEQKEIVEILSSLDDKIELLYRQNKTLEALAEALFHQCFIENVRDDWELISLKDICTHITKGTTPTTLGHKFSEAGVNFIKAESITDDGDFIFRKFAKITEETHSFLARSIIESGDVLCSIAGTIGRIAIADQSILPANTNQAIAILRTDKRNCFSEYIYLFLKSSLFQDVMAGKIVHAVQPNLSLGEIGNTPINLPPPDFLEKFRCAVMPIFDKKRACIKQMRSLEAMRDVILPKLMSGEIRVKHDPKNCEAA